ncbi:two-component regulator propeller domain-containing protein [Arcicella aquatica]|uniref:Two-component regulator propeller domain-containing protein n=1 Tax=Arcicella aquatica TaxID=217141 RepID=A0ABU5QH46_9BACT|nr:hypothetical protein [Arcicella aquatica]MEA5256353.1 two-component regulator propeller domain-containing protein [Arcicella aquatica]
MTTFFKTYLCLFVLLFITKNDLFAQKVETFLSDNVTGASFLIDKDESVWVGSTGGIIHYDKEYNILQKISIEDTKWFMDTTSVETLVKDNKTGIIWASIGFYPYGGVYAFDREKILQENQISNDFQPEEALFFFDKFGRNWICYEKGTKFVQLGIDSVHTKYDWKEGGISKFMKTNITLDNAGNIWVAINSTLYKFDGKKWNYYDSKNSILPKDFFSMITSDKEGNILVSGWDDIYKVNMVSKTLVSIPYPLNSNILGCFFKTHDGKIKISTSNRIYDLSDSTLSLSLTTNSLLDSQTRITSMIEDTKGNLLLGSYNKIVIYDGQTLKLFNSGSSLALPSNIVSQISIDEQNNIWISSNIFATKPIRFNPVTNDIIVAPNTGSVICFGKNQEVWIGGFETISKYDGKNWTTVASPVSVSKKIATDKEDNLWLLAYKDYWFTKRTDLYRLKNDTWERFSLNFHINDIIHNNENGMFLATTDGLLTYDGKNIVKLSSTDKSITIPDTINKLYVDPLGVLWVFPEKSADYLLKYDGNVWVKWIIPTGFIIDRSETSNRFIVDKNGNLWSGTVDGLYKYDGKTVNYYNVRNTGLLNNNIATIQIAQDDNIWVGTKHGIAVLTDCQGLKPTVNQQPSAQSVLENTKVIFEIKGENVKTYQWQISIDKGITWSNIGVQDTLYQGQQSSTLSKTSAFKTDNGYLYRCGISTACETAYSNAALLEVITILGNEQLLENIIKVFPNPTQDQIKIQLPQKSFKAYLLNNNGILLKQVENQDVLSVKEFPVGVYVLLIDVGEMKFSRKIAIVR